jgi:hypothetical protein
MLKRWSLNNSENRSRDCAIGRYKSVEWRAKTAIIWIKDKKLKISGKITSWKILSAIPWYAY